MKSISKRMLRYYKDDGRIAERHYYDKNGIYRTRYYLDGRRICIKRAQAKA